MKWVAVFRKNLQGLTESVARYPLTTAFLMASAAVTAVSIENSGMEDIYGILILTFVTGVFLSTVAQVLHERFFPAPAHRWLFSGIACLLVLGYYYTIKDVPEVGTVILVRTAAFLSALFVAFIWLPSIKAKITFNESFIAVFKALFTSIFFSGVIFAGTGIILSAVNLLLFRINYPAFAHAANIIFVLFAPMYFLSLVPNYNVEEKDRIQNAVSCPRFLEVLISNIIIPMVSIFTIILVLYITLNITGDFWKDNLTEPMLVAYSIVVIVVYILADNLENKFANAFKKIFPKVLIPVVLFQILASVLKIGDVGLTHNRYYVIMYGLFAMVAGCVYSFFRSSRNSIVPAALIVLSIVSIVPPVDAFTVSKTNQIRTLEKTLVRNEMLVDNAIVGKSNIPLQDRTIIINTVSYISRLGYAGEVSWLPDNFEYYTDFERTFGFSLFDFDGRQPPEIYSYSRNRMDAIDITGYDMMAVVFISSEGREFPEVQMTFQGDPYSMIWKPEEGGHFLLQDGDGSEVISLKIQEVFDRFTSFPQRYGELSAEEATFTAENEKARKKIVINHIEIIPNEREPRWYGEIGVFIGLK